MGKLPELSTWLLSVAAESWAALPTICAASPKFLAPPVIIPAADPLTPTGQREYSYIEGQSLTLIDRDAEASTSGYRKCPLNSYCTMRSASQAIRVKPAEAVQHGKWGAKRLQTWRWHPLTRRWLLLGQSGIKWQAKPTGRVAHLKVVRLNAKNGGQLRSIPASTFC
jgi:hypothetical protein